MAPPDAIFELEIPTNTLMPRDQLNSRFHGRDIFREIGLLP